MNSQGGFFRQADLSHSSSFGFFNGLTALATLRTSVSLSPSHLSHSWASNCCRNVALPLRRCHAGLFPVGTEGPDWYRDQLQAVRDPPQIQETVAGRLQLTNILCTSEKRDLLYWKVILLHMRVCWGLGSFRFFVLFFAWWLSGQICSLRGCGRFVMYRVVVNNKATFLPKCTKEMHK